MLPEMDLIEELIGKQGGSILAIEADKKPSLKLPSTASYSDMSAFGSFIPQVNECWSDIQRWLEQTPKIGKRPTKMALLYRGSEHGFTAESFHSRCDGNAVSTSITFILSEHGKAFGGFCSTPWSSETYSDFMDESAFIFSLNHRTRHGQH